MSRQETERMQQLHRTDFDRRTAANRILATYVRITEESPNPDQISEQVIGILTGLSATRRPGIRTISPEEEYEIAKSAAQFNISGVAKGQGKSYWDTRRYMDTVTAVMAFVLQRKGLIPEPDPSINQQRYTQIREIQREADVIGYAVNRPAVSIQLQHMPDLKAAMESYQKYLTLKPFLIENNMLYDPKYVCMFNSDFRNYLFGHEYSRIGHFLRKTTFSRWLHRKTNWYDEDQNEITERINASAKLVYSVSPPKEKSDRARHIRFFLDEIMAEEFAMAQRDIYFGCAFSLEELFMPVNGHQVEQLVDIDIAKTYAVFADYCYYPEAFNRLIQKYIESREVPQVYDCLISDMHCKNLAYTDAYKKKWLTAGFSFLENILLLNPEQPPSWINLDSGRKGRLGKLRNTFQRNLPGGRFDPQRF